VRSSADLIEFTRFLIGEKTSRYFRNGHLCSCLSAAQHRIAAMLRKADSGFFETYEDYTMVADQGNYDLPGFFKSPLKVERIDGNYATTPKEINHRRQTAPGGRSSFTTWDIKGNEIWFSPAPTSATPQYRLWYSFYLPDMLYCHLGTGSDQNTIVLASTPDAEDDYRLAVAVDDYYNSLTVEMISGDESGETAVVSDYDGEARTLELAVGFSGNASAGEIISSHIQIPEDMWEPLALLAAHLSRARDREGRYIYGREFSESIKFTIPEAMLRLSGMGEVQLYGVDGAI
jgi:hypothetical protein